jgi:uncharacterized membrane protein YdfJ with MMPL/SSD domain
MEAASKSAYVSANMIDYFKQKKERFQKRKQAITDPQNQIPEQQDSGSEDDFDKRSICSVNSAELDGDINLSDDEEQAERVRSANKKKRGDKQGRHI